MNDTSYLFNLQFGTLYFFPKWNNSYSLKGDGSIIMNVSPAAVTTV